LGLLIASEQILSRAAVVSAALKFGDELALSSDVTLAVSDVLLHESEMLTKNCVIHCHSMAKAFSMHIAGQWSHLLRCESAAFESAQAPSGALKDPAKEANSA